MKGAATKTWGLESVIEPTTDYLFDPITVRGTRYTPINGEETETVGYLRTLCTRDRLTEERANTEAFYSLLQRSPTLKTTTLGAKLIACHYDERTQNKQGREIVATFEKIQEFLHRHNRIVATDQRLDTLEQWLIKAFRSHCSDRQPFPQGQANLVVTAVQSVILGGKRGAHIITPYSNTPQAFALLMQGLPDSPRMMTSDALQRLKDADIRVYGATCHENYRLWFTTQKPEEIHMHS